jgi:hypothetical protein
MCQFTRGNVCTRHASSNEGFGVPTRTWCGEDMGSSISMLRDVCTTSVLVRVVAILWFLTWFRRWRLETTKQSDSNLPSTVAGTLPQQCMIPHSTTSQRRRHGTRQSSFTRVDLSRVALVQSNKRYVNEATTNSLRTSWKFCRVRGVHVGCTWVHVGINRYTFSERVESVLVSAGELPEWIWQLERHTRAFKQALHQFYSIARPENISRIDEIFSK